MRLMPGVPVYVFAPAMERPQNIERPKSEASGGGVRRAGSQTSHGDDHDCHTEKDIANGYADGDMLCTSGIVRCGGKV